MSLLFDDEPLRTRLAGEAASWAEANLPSWPDRMDRECEILAHLVRERRPAGSRAA